VTPASPKDRRAFLVTTLGCAACCGALASCASSPSGPPPPPLATGPVDVGTPADYPADGITSRFTRTHGFYLVRASARLIAVSATCTHRRCAVDPDGSSPQFICACHGSRFTSAGIVLKGPASISLPRFGISLNSAGHAIVDASSRFEEAEYDQPGSYITLA
jgi:nitrite reductase/ring-hydroxylating ferredoxin subunit